MDRHQRNERMFKELEVGDIVFYRTSQADTFFDLTAEHFDDFPVLAAFGQGLPYALGSNANMWSPTSEHFKPWHHVAVCVSNDDATPMVAGFNSDIGDGGLGRFNIAELDLGEFEMIDVLRPPGDTGAEIARLASEFDKTEYATHGLLAFSLATYARMLPSGPMRDDAMLTAYRANAAAKATSIGQETCVTAVAKAIEAAGGACDPIVMPEPTPPVQHDVERAFRFELSPIYVMFERLVGRVWRASGDIFNQLGARKLIFGSLTHTIIPSVGVPDFGTGPISRVDEVTVSFDSAHVGRLDRRLPLPVMPADAGEQPPIPVAPPADPALPPVGAGLPLVNPMPVLITVGPTTSPWENPGNGISVAQFSEILRGLSMELGDKVAPGDPAYGLHVATDSAQSDDFLASPAMLWDALVDCAFGEIMSRDVEVGLKQATARIAART